MQRYTMELEDLFRDFYRSMRKESGIILAEHGLTNSEFQFLRTIDSLGGAQASEIATEMGVRRGYISNLSRRLEEMQLIKRSSMEEDARAVRLTLTVQGEKLYHMLKSRVRSILSAKIAKLTDPEMDTLLKLFSKLNRQDNSETI